MRATPILLVLTILTTSHYAHANDDPFASARKGMLMCYAPDSDMKTCAALSRFEWDAEGNVWEDGELPISANPRVTVKTKVKASIEGSTLCEIVDDATPHAPIFLANGKLVSEEDYKQYIEAYQSRFSQLYGKRVCIDISPYESVFITQVSVDGTPYPSATSRMRWVSADEGYVLAP